MDFRDTLSEGLPAPRDDEPAVVRRDILDELADHLACAYSRELKRGSKPGEARQWVFERFGDPVAVARRLWLDAIGAKLMLQRILLVTCLVVSLASLSLTGALWIQNSRAQRDSARAAVEALRAMAQENTRAREGQQQMVQQLRAMAEEIRNTRSLDWNPLTFQLTEETPDGPPAVGFQVTLREAGANAGAAFGGGVGGAGAGRPATRLTDDSGTADFGLVHPGNYFFSIRKDWEQGFVQHSGPLTVDPGSRIMKKVVCPKTPLDRVAVRFRADWPADLQKERLVLYARFYPKELLANGLSWHFGNFEVAQRADALLANRSFGGAGYRPIHAMTVLFGLDSPLTEVVGSKHAYLWGPDAGPRWADLAATHLREITAPEATLKWERGAYGLLNLLVLRPRESPPGGPLRRFELLAVVLPSQGFGTPGMIAGTSQNVFTVRQDPPVGPEEIQASRPNADMRIPSPPLVKFPEQNAAPMNSVRFEAKPGQVNEWTIPLWDELVTAVRESVKVAGSR
jgi:hypothetical protein